MQNLKFTLGRVENMVGKEENPGWQCFHPSKNEYHFLICNFISHLQFFSTFIMLPLDNFYNIVTERKFVGDESRRHFEEKEKLLVSSIFSFFHNALYSLSCLPHKPNF